MKKRMVSLLLALLIVIALPMESLATTGIAQTNEDFSIRNGIRFGMSKDEVKALEESNGYKYGHNIGFGVFTDDYLHDIRLGNAKVNLYYRYKNDVLCSFYYSAHKNQPYDEVRQRLISKYGTPMYANEISPIMTCAWEMLWYKWSNTQYKVVGKEQGYSNPEKYDCWWVEFNDCFTVIELIRFENSQYFALGYLLIDKNEMDNLLVSIQKGNDAVQQSYSDGL